MIYIFFPKSQQCHEEKEFKSVVPGAWIGAREHPVWVVSRLAFPWLMLGPGKVSKGASVAAIPRFRELEFARLHLEEIQVISSLVRWGLTYRGAHRLQQHFHCRQRGFSYPYLAFKDENDALNNGGISISKDSLSSTVVKSAMTRQVGQNFWPANDESGPRQTGKESNEIFI